MVSAILAARAAKQLGVRWCIIQDMLATPRATWGVNDLAKSRVLLRLARELEGPRFTCFLQTRGGLDSFSPDPQTARRSLPR